MHFQKAMCLILTPPYAQSLALNNEAEKATEFVQKVAVDPNNTNAGSLLWEKGQHDDAFRHCGLRFMKP